ncbi:MAG: S1 RNA-binding domain-containing protein [Candidatus Melainabacteria bacterium]|nr:S1 RNA-binding domain-containing protein [Candidatus Melainabacteria bacterium]
MSKKSTSDLIAELKLERKENYPELKHSTRATVIAKSPNGLYLDMARAFEGHVSLKELGDKNLDEYSIGEVIEVFVAAEDRNQPGIFKLSIKQLEENHKWEKLNSLKEQELELKIVKVLKSGVEVEILETKQIGFIPYGYLDSREEPLKGQDKNNWLGLVIRGKIHELEQSRNKIILNHKVIAEKIRETRAKEIFNEISKGQRIKGTVVRTADFGVFVDIGGLDALVPSSELSWARFKKPSDLVKVGDEIEAIIFKIDPEKSRVALSVKQAQPDPWSTLGSDYGVGYSGKGKVVTQADFGVFIEVLPGVEALLHKSNFEGEEPKLGDEIEYQIINLETNKKRMGIKLVGHDQGTEVETSEEKEPEHV